MPFYLDDQTYARLQKEDTVDPILQDFAVQADAILNPPAPPWQGIVEDFRQKAASFLGNAGEAVGQTEQGRIAAEQPSPTRTLPTGQQPVEGTQGPDISGLPGALGRAALDVATSNPYTPFSQIVKQTTGLGQAIPSDEQAIAQAQDDPFYRAMVRGGVPEADAAHQVLATKMYAMGMADAPIGKVGAGQGPARAAEAPKAPETVGIPPVETPGTLGAITPQQRAAAEAEMQTAFGNAIRRDVAQGNIAEGALRPEQRAAMERVAGVARGFSEGEMGAIRLPQAPAAPRAIDSPNPTIAATAKMYEQGLAGPANPATLDRAWTAVVRATADRGVDLKKFQDLAAKMGTPLTPEQMVSYQSRANPTGPAVIKLQQELRPALLEVGPNQDYLSQYITHVQDIDRANVAGQRVYDAAITAGKTPAEAATKQADFLANKFTLPGGHTLADAQSALAAIPGEVGPGAWGKIQAAGRQVQDFARALLDRKLEAGVISQDFHDALVNLYPNYVPTRILEFMDNPEAFVPGVKKLSLSDQGVRKYVLQGTDLTREDPLASLVRSAYATERIAQKNIAANALIKARDVIPGMDQVIKEVPNGYPAKTGLNEQTISLFDQGVKKTYLLPSEMAAIIENKPMGSTLFDLPMSLFKALTTGRNPLFIPWNAARDIATYMVTQTTAAGGPTHIPAILAELFTAYGDAFKGLASGTYQGTTAEYLKSGGWMLGRYSGGLKETAQTVRDLSKANFYTIRDGKDLQQFITDALTLTPVQEIGGRVELAPRTAAYNLAQKRGGSALESAIAGREATVDFEMGGNFARTLNQFIPFFNVGMQGMLLAPRTFRKNPRSFISTAIALVAGPAIAAEAWNRSDPQRAKDYEDVPNFIKSQGIPVMLPRNLFPPRVDKQGNEYPQFVLLPMRDFLPIALVAQEVTRKAMGDSAPTDWGDLVSNSVAGISPTQATSPVSALAPGLQTAVELQTNQDTFRNRMIATERNDKQASALAKAIAYGLNAASGVAGGGDIARPSQVEFAMTDPTGGVGQMAQGVSEMLSPQKPPKTGIQGTPVVGGLAGRWVRDSTGAQLQKARENLLTVEDRKMLKETGADWQPSPAGYSIGKVALTNAEELTYQQIVNEQIHKMLAPLGHSPAWKAADPEVKKKYLDQRSDEIRSQVRDYIAASGGRDFLYRQYLAETGQVAGR